MATYDKIHEIVLRSGVWDGTRRETHSFELTPDIFHLSVEQQQTLTELGPLLRRVMAAASRILAIAIDPDLGSTGRWRTLRRHAELDVQKTQVAMQRCFPQRNPLITKVDLIEAEDGRLYIGEIDAMNRRAMGYASLFAEIARTVQPTGPRPVGVAPMLNKVVTRMGKNKLLFVYGDRERFYLPEFQILKSVLALHDIDLVILSEMQIEEIKVALDDWAIVAGGRTYYCPILVNVPEFHKQMHLAEDLAAAYIAGKVRVLLPPKPFLGSKGLLALLSNPNGDEEYEAILRSQLRREDIDAIRRLIPTTTFIDREEDGAGKILKQMVSSGAKGIVFPDDPDHAKILNQPRTRGRYVAQELIAGRRRTFRRFVSPSGETVQEERYTRLVAYVIDGELAEVVVTATTDPCVHGGPTAVNMGVVYDE